MGNGEWEIGNGIDGLEEAKSESKANLYKKDTQREWEVGKREGDGLGDSE